MAEKQFSQSPYDGSGPAKDCRRIVIKPLIASSQTLTPEHPEWPRTDAPIECRRAPTQLHFTVADGGKFFASCIHLIGSSGERTRPFPIAGGWRLFRNSACCPTSHGASRRQVAPIPLLKLWIQLNRGDHHDLGNHTAYRAGAVVDRRAARLAPQSQLGLRPYRRPGSGCSDSCRAATRRKALVGSRNGSMKVASYMRCAWPPTSRYGITI